jgi:methionyl-tRNA formyltransferase
MGTPEFAVPSLDILLRNGYNLPAVVTAPDKPRGRGRLVSPTSIKTYALRHGLAVLQPESMREPRFRDSVADYHPDLIVVVAFRILPKDIFTIPRLGSFNLHASLLPKYRGAAPINWAIINGETETGVTTFYLQEQVDTGTIILQRAVPIGFGDDAGVLHDRLAVVGADIVLETVRLIESGNASPCVQDDSAASPAPKIFKDDCRIHWGQPALRVHNFIRGLSPHPSAYTTHEGKVLKIFRTEPTVRPAADPGTVEVIGDSLFVSTADTLLDVLELQQEGKKRMSGPEFLRGSRISGGDRLG